MRRVSPTKGNLVIPESNNTTIGDSHAMCVGAEVTKHLFGSSEGWFAVDNPARNVKLADKVPKGLDLSQASEPALEPELSGGVSLPEGFDELAAEDLTENPYREEELVLVGV